jgi:hypothetical protein
VRFSIQTRISVAESRKFDQIRQAQATTLLLQCRELLPEGEIFEEKIAARANKPKQQPQEKGQQT